MKITVSRLRLDQVNITVSLDKTFQGFTKLNLISDYKKLPSYAFAYPIIPFMFLGKPFQFSVNYYMGKF